MNKQQSSIFEFLLEDYTLDPKKQNKIIELFAGYGSQFLATKYMGMNFQSHKIVEWAWKSIKAYKNLHHWGDERDFTLGVEDNKVFEFLASKGVSNDYNKPMTLSEIKRKGIKWAKETYNNVHITNNLVNIMQVKGEDLEIKEKDKNNYVLTYSFPCITGDALVITENRGYVRLDEIVLGDVVQTHTGEWHPVTKVFDNGKRETMTMSGQCLLPLTTTFEHKIWVREQNSQNEFSKPFMLEAEKIKPFIHYVGMPINDKKDEKGFVVNRDIEFLKNFFQLKHEENLKLNDRNDYFDNGDKLKTLIFDKKEEALMFQQIISKIYNTPCVISTWKYDEFMLMFNPNSGEIGGCFYEDGWIWSPITNIYKHKTISNVYDLEVEKDLTFVANNIAVNDCQDLSLSGLRKGMDVSQSEDGGTRSGLLWEVERILNELNALDNNRGGHLPDVLLMENVPQVISKDNMANMEKWDFALQKLGYSSYIKNLIATDYKIPQTRNRTFMISVLGNYSYTFPRSATLKNFVKDFLEPKVDEKYFLSDKQIIDVQNWKAYQKPLENIVSDNDVVPTITTRSGAYAAGMILYGEENDNMDNVKEYVNYLSIKDDKGRHNTQDHRVYHKDLVGTIPAMERGIPKILVPEATKKGYAEAEAGDGVYLNRPHQKRGVVQKGMIQTLKTSGQDVGVVVEDNRTGGEKFTDLLIENNLVNEGDIIKWTRNAKILAGEKSIVEMEGEKGLMPTITTRHDALGIVVADDENIDEQEIVVGKYNFSSSENFMQGRERLQIESADSMLLDTILTNPKKGIVLQQPISKKLRVRKLTPKECGRFMGIKDEDIDKIMFDQSESSSYHLFGDSIVTTVLMGIFGGLKENNDWKERVDWLKNK